MAVIVCVVLDKTRTTRIGYGKKLSQKINLQSLTNVSGTIVLFDIK